MNSLIEVYGSRQIWEKRLTECIAGIVATEPDRSAKAPDPSYRTAMEEMVQAGFAHLLLTEKQIGQWGGSEKILSIVQESFSQLNDSSSSRKAEILGSVLHTLENAKFLGSEKHQITHLVLNYLGTHCNHPLFVFRKEDNYSQAIQSLSDAQSLLAEKLREAVIARGAFLERRIHTRLTDRYCRPGEQKPELTIHWNDLVESKRVS